MVRPTDVLTCYLTRRRLGALVDGALEGDQRSVAASHAAACDRCRRDVEELHRLRSLIRRSLGNAVAPDWAGFWPGVIRGIEAPPVAVPAHRVPFPAWAQRRPRVALGGALAAALLASFTAWQFAGAPAPTESPIFVRSADTDVPGASVMVYSPPERDMAVVWLLALEE